MSRTPAILLAAASLLCLASVGFHLRATAVYAAQEPELRPPSQQQQQPPAAQQPRRRQDAHTMLGLGRVPDAESAKRGEPLYEQNCQACHGKNARGGIGPNLVRSVLVLHDDKGEEISPVVRNGRPQTGMPPFKSLTDAQISDIAEYLHLEVELAANRGLYKGADTMTSGDPEKGKAYFAANCAGCHSVTGNLASIATKYPQPAALMVRIAWPSDRNPRNATVTTPDGKTLTGTLAHYDDFETTLKLADGSTQTWPTDTIKVDIPDKLAGHRALLPKLSDDDLHNLTRYLLTIK